jgi:protoporphyrinogen oxidase
MPRLVVIGGGISGASMFYHMRMNYPEWEVILLERGSEVGGINRNIEVEGLRFSLGSRYIFGLNPFTVDTVLELAGSDCKLGQSLHSVFYKGRFLDFPVQMNTSGLSLRERVECLWGLFRRSNKKDVWSFEDWAIAKFGEPIARKFILSHVTKCWKVDPGEIDFTGSAKKVMEPNARGMFWGGVRRPKPFANNEFLYPVGGIGTIVNEMIARAKSGNNIQKAWAIDRTNFMVYAVDMSERKVVSTEGEEVEYDALVSTIPMPGLVNLIHNSNIGVPQDVVLAGEKLRFNCMASVMLAFEGDILNGREEHFIYVPEKRYRFSRVSIPRNFDPSSCPDGHTSLLVEISFGKEQKKLLFREDYQRELAVKIVRDVEALFPCECGLGRKLKGFAVGVIDPSYIITDENYHPARNKVIEYLRQNDIHMLGRFGKWDWSRIEDTIPESHDLSHRIGGKPWLAMMATGSS